MSPARALLLDALGTIVELPAPAPALGEELRRRLGIELGSDELARGVGAEIAFYRAHFDQARDLERLARLRLRCAEVLRDELPALAGVPLPDVRDALLGALRFRAYPDVEPALLAARARGLRVVVASNWDVSLPETLARVGLSRLLDGVVTSAMVGARKPSARVFASALALAGSPAAAAVHVGDTLAEDVDGALAAGLRAVLLDRDRHAAGVPGGVPVITSLAELGPLL